jgi:hypothetical protein
MQYKTIVLGLLEERKEMYELLRRDRALLPTLERMASDLKTSHEAWKKRLVQDRPGSGEAQMASAALELALQELQNRLPPASDDIQAFNLDEAMAFLRRHTSPE